MKPSPTWVVPIGNVEARIVITAGVQLTMPAAEMTAMEACQLGHALLDASREAGAIKAKGRR